MLIDILQLNQAHRYIEMYAEHVREQARREEIVHEECDTLQFHIDIQAETAKNKIDNRRDALLLQLKNYRESNILNCGAVCGHDTEKQVPDKFPIGVVDNYLKIFFEVDNSCLKLADIIRPASSSVYVATTPNELLAIYDGTLHLYDVDEEGAKFRQTKPSLSYKADVYALAYMDKDNFAIFDCKGLSVFNCTKMAFQQIRPTQKKTFFGSSKEKLWGRILYALYVRGFLFCASTLGLVKIDTRDWSFVKNERFSFASFIENPLTFIADKDVFVVITRNGYITIVDFNLSAPGTAFIQKRISQVVYRPLTRDMVAIGASNGHNSDDEYSAVYIISTTTWKPTKQIKLSSQPTVVFSSETHILIGSWDCIFLFDHELRLIRRCVTKYMFTRPYKQLLQTHQCLFAVYGGNWCGKTRPLHLQLWNLTDMSSELQQYTNYIY